MLERSPLPGKCLLVHAPGQQQLHFMTCLVHPHNEDVHKQHKHMAGVQYMMEMTDSDTETKS